MQKIIVLKNAAIITCGNDTENKDIAINNGKIEAVGTDINIAGAEIIDCRGKLLMPGLIDAHVHLREPGFEKKETIKSGTQAAAAGGFTTVMAMPNLKPVPDSPEVMKDYLTLIKKNAVVNVAPYASITKGEKGETVVDMKAMLEAGAAAFSDDGVGVQSDDVMRAAMKKAAELDTIIVAHTEDNSLKNGGYVHQGEYAEKMGFRGIPSACEYAQAARDIDLVRETGCRYHICHVSAAETIELVRKAKAEGLRVTCEITPHHLTLIDEDVKDSNGKMNPPLRSAKDREALIEAINDGTADIVATDHAPHSQEEKMQGLEKAPFGIVGLETAFPVIYTELVKTGKLTLKRLQEVMSEKPAEIFGFGGKGRIEPGMDADLALADTEAEYVIDPDKFMSAGRNTPYSRKKVFGKILLTIVDGKVVYDGR